MTPRRIIIDECLWVRGEIVDKWTNARSEAAALRARGAKIFMLKHCRDTEGLQRLRDLLWKSDVHVILARLWPNELAAIKPLLRARKNFSVVVEDWWSVPHWFLREAEYIIFRNYGGIAVRTGRASLVDGPQPPLLFNPFPQVAKYTLIASLLRPPALVLSPLVNAANWWRRRGEPINPKRYLYCPFPVSAADVPLREEKLQFDFSNTGGTSGIWVMRDPFASFKYTFTNLYYDRQRLTDSIAVFRDNPFKFYDCRREKRLLPYDEYARKNQQARYLITTGGLHLNSVPKFLEYACVGTPMIGRRLPFEHPWLDDCLFDVDIMRLSPAQLKPLLHQALDRYPVMRENCLKWRDRLLKLYDMNVLMDMLQAQIDGQPIPPGYLRPEALPLKA